MFILIILLSIVIDDSRTHSITAHYRWVLFRELEKHTWTFLRHGEILGSLESLAWIGENLLLLRADRGGRVVLELVHRNGHTNRERDGGPAPRPRLCLAESCLVLSQLATPWHWEL
jgi:hypothetical protein